MAPDVKRNNASMIEAKYFDLAKQCTEQYFKDCQLVDIIRSDSVTKRSSSRYLSVDGKTTKIGFSRTTKVVLDDKCKCKSCGAKSTYAMHLYNVNSKKDMIAFVVMKDDIFVPLTKDHIVAKMLGGRDTLKNLQSLCYPCNQNKAHNRIEAAADNGKTIVISVDEYERLNTKQTDFANARSIIKKSIKRVPWWLKLLGVHKYIERKIKKPIHDMGYYGNNLTKE